jgi:hypothetical protein
VSAEGIVSIIVALTTLVAAVGALVKAWGAESKVGEVHDLVNSRLSEFIERYDRMEESLKEVREVLARERADRVAERVAARKAGEGPQL